MSKFKTLMIGVKSRSGFVGVVVLLMACLDWSAAHAAEGVLEINQTCAVNGGCFPGDTAGFPVTISEKGAYRLTSNLVVPDENTTAIFVPASFVDIDLGGFVIQGPGIVGTGSGVLHGNLEEGLRVRNGSIVGVGQLGIFTGRASHIRNVSIQSAGSEGIAANPATMIRDCTIRGSGGNGITATSGSLVIGNVIDGNAFLGAGLSGLLLDNVIRENGLLGATTGMFVAVGGNVFTDNNGGNAFPQTQGSPLEVAGNVCGTDAVCP